MIKPAIADIFICVTNCPDMFMLISFIGWALMHISGMLKTFAIWQKKRLVMKSALVGASIIVLKIKCLFRKAITVNARNTIIILIILALSSSRWSQKVSSFFGSSLSLFFLKLIATYVKITFYKLTTINYQLILSKDKKQSIFLH